MARRTYPRSNERHRVAAAEVLNRHASACGTSISLPIPIEMIVERTYGLTIEWDDIEEPPDHRILGALSPSTRTIVMNTRHLQTFDQWVGPERFTLAHELAHWIYDAEDPGQGVLGFSPVDEVFCRRDDTSGVDETTRLREQNANGLAAHILLPDDLVKAHDLAAVLADFKATAHAWGVSQQTLRIKLQRLGVLDDPNGGSQPKGVAQVRNNRVRSWLRRCATRQRVAESTTAEAGGDEHGQRQDAPWE